MYVRVNMVKINNYKTYGIVVFNTLIYILILRNITLLGIIFRSHNIGLYFVLVHPNREMDILV